MELIKCSIDNCDLKNNGLVATIGQFDGIHIAHQILIEKVCELSEEKELKSGKKKNFKECIQCVINRTLLKAKYFN